MDSTCSSDTHVCGNANPNENANTKTKTNTKGNTEIGVTYWTKLDDVISDLRQFLKQEKEKRPDVPIILLGESMGALITVPLAIEHDPNVDAIITAGGLFKMTKETQPPPIVCLMFEILGRFFPKMNIRVKELDATFDSAFGDERWAAEARSDPYGCTDSFYLGPASEYFRYMKLLRREASRVSVPLYVMHSRTDT